MQQLFFAVLMVSLVLTLIVWVLTLRNPSDESMRKLRNVVMVFVGVCLATVLMARSGLW